MVLTTVTAIHTFVAEHGDELEFSAGEQIEILERDDAFGDGWWKGRNAKGEEGLFPATYISEDPDYVPPPAAAAGADGVAAEPGAAALKSGDADGTPNDVPTPRSRSRSSSPVQVPASPGLPQPSPPTAAVSTPPLATSDKLGTNINPASPYSTAALAPENRNSLLDASGAPRGTTLAAAGAAGVVGAGVGAAGAHAANAGAPASSTVMDSTIGRVQQAIDTMGGSPPPAATLNNTDRPAGSQGVQLRDPQEAAATAAAVPPAPAAVPAAPAAPSANAYDAAGRDVVDDDDDDADDAGGVGIAHDARARLAQQAKLANEERDRRAQRESGGIAGLVYSDESEEEDEHSSHRGSDMYNRMHHNGTATTPTIDEAIEPEMSAAARYAAQNDPSLSPVRQTALPTTSAPQPESQVNGGMLPHGSPVAAAAADASGVPAPATSRGPSGAALAGVAAAGAGAAGIGAAMLSSDRTKESPVLGGPVPPSQMAADATTQTRSPHIQQQSSPYMKQSPQMQQAPQFAKQSPQMQQAPQFTKQPSPRADHTAQLQPALPIAAAATQAPPAPVHQTPPTHHTPTLGSAIVTPGTQSATASPATPAAPAGGAPQMPTSPPATWGVTEVIQWARSRGFDEAVTGKFVEHDISGDVLLDLDANLLKELDIPQLGKRLRIASAINDLRRPASAGSHSQQQMASAQQSPAPSGEPQLASSSTSARSASQPPSGYPASAGLAAAGAAGVAGVGAAGYAAHQHASASPSGSPVVDEQTAFTHGRKVSVTPRTSSIDEAKAFGQDGNQPKVFGGSTNNNAPANGNTNGHTATRSVSSVPTTPASPAVQHVMKRESTGSLGHKKKGSVDRSDRLSFFGRGRKQPPPGSPGTMGERSSSSRLGSLVGVGGGGMKPAMNTIHADRPEKRASSGSAAQSHVGLALRTIGTPDKSGYLKKKGDRYNSWRTRFLVLKGSHLYYLKSETEDHVKGHIELTGHRIVVDEDVPGQFGFRLIGPGVEKPHFFASTDQDEVRDWMKTLMKATIKRDYAVPVTSSCNIPTIPLSEAQALQPRPPSPGERDATQRANRRENVNQLTPRDASVLMSLEPSSGRRLTSHSSGMSAVTAQPSRPSRDTRRPSTSARSPRPSASYRPTDSYHPPEPTAEQAELLKWVNTVLPPQFPRVKMFPNSFISGEVIFLLVKHLSGKQPNPPVPASAFVPDEHRMPNAEGLLAMRDIVEDAGIMDALELPPILEGDADAITGLLGAVRGWAVETGKA